MLGMCPRQGGFKLAPVTPQLAPVTMFRALAGTTFAIPHPRPVLHSIAMTIIICLQQEETLP
jgi:hypothetical protein